MSNNIIFIKIMNLKNSKKQFTVSISHYFRILNCKMNFAVI